MNRNHEFVFTGMKLQPLCAALLILGAVAESSMAQPVDSHSLTAGATSAKVDAGSAMGMYEWIVDGVNQLNQQSFFLALGSGPQTSIYTAPTRIATLTAANALTTTYFFGSFNVQVDYTLNHIGTGAASIDESVTIHNTTSSDITGFRFYQYSDFNLGGVPAGDSITVDSYSAFQQKGALRIAEGIIDPMASYFEANTTGGTTSTLYKLNNLSGVNLNGADTASGDVTWAFQWDLTLESGVDTILLKNKSLYIKPIPEPSALALLALGLGLWTLPKRR